MFPKDCRKSNANEPLAAAFSAEKAAEYLDRSALNWQKTKKCATCHSNLFYMAARPALASVLPNSGEVRGFYEDYRKVRWQKKGPVESQGFWPVVVGTGLTFNDLQTTGKLSESRAKSSTSGGRFSAPTAAGNGRTAITPR
jgi:squalene-hopene/tetraprenyl-beta-curcumene cyclase